LPLRSINEVEGATLSENRKLVQRVYEAFAIGDIPSVLGFLAADVRWTEAAGGPYGGVSIGPEAVLNDVFMKLGGEWDGYAAVPREFIADGATVVVLGEYSGTYKATGKSFKAPFAHVWKLKDGKATSFEQYTDTAIHRLPLTA
jgi:ketosteroid isomerase-like protein